MNTTSLATIFQKKLIRWILVPGLLMTVLIVAIIGVNQRSILQREIVQLSRSLSQNVGFYMDGSEDILRSMALMSAEENQEQQRESFAKLQKSFGRFERLMLLDARENIVVVAPRGIKGVDFPIRFDTPDHDEHVLTSPIISPHSGALVVYLSLPAHGGGKIVAELSLDALQKFIYGFLSTDRIIILTDAYGNLIVHPDQELVRMQANIGSLEIFSRPANPDTAGFYTADGVSYFGTLSRIPGTGWKLLVACPAKYIHQPIVALGVLVSLLITSASLALLFVLRKEFRISVVAPIRMYLEKLSALAKGRYPTTKSREGEYIELNEFGTVFDGMAAKVREREQDLRVAKLFFQSIIDSMPSALIWVDDDLFVQQCNATAQELFGETTPDAPPRHVDAFFSGRKELSESIAEAGKRGRPRTLERRKVGHGNAKLYDITVFPLIGSEKGGVVVRMDDVSARVRMEEIMVQTEKMMSVGGLAAGMAHEINNPLAGILLGVQNLEHRLDPRLDANTEALRTLGGTMDCLQRYLAARKIPQIIDGIKESGQRAAGIVANMLEFSRPGRSAITSVNVIELIDATLELTAKDYDLKKRYDFQHITIRREFAPDLPEILCSRTEIEQVLFNLLKNAAQAMLGFDRPDRTPVITLRANRHDDGVLLEIEDNGPGMTPEVCRRIFEPFFTTKPLGEGTGLGLSVSYFIITQNHGGTLVVESEPGQWTRFTITLPASPPQTTANGRAT